MGKQTAENALLFRDPLNAEGIRSKDLTVFSGAWGGGNQYLDCIYTVYKELHVDENHPVLLKSEYTARELSILQ